MNSLPEDSEFAFASTLWIDRGRNAESRFAPQPTRVASTEFPSTFELAFFEAPDDFNEVPPACPAAVREKLEGEASKYEQSFHERGSAWPLMDEILLVVTMYDYFDEGVRAADYAYALPEIDALGSIPETREAHGAYRNCREYAETLRFVEAKAFAQKRECFLASDIVVFTHSDAETIPPFERLADQVQAKATKYALLYVEDPTLAQHDPDACTLRVENPDALRAGYNLAEVHCAKSVLEDPEGGSLKVIDPATELILRKADRFDLLRDGARCDPEINESIRLLSPPLPAGPLTQEKAKTSLALKDALEDAVARNREITPQAKLVHIIGGNIDSHGLAKPEVVPRGTKGWVFIFVNEQNKHATLVLYTGIYRMTGRPDLTIVHPRINDQYASLQAIDDADLERLPDSPEVFRMFADAGCDLQGANQLAVLSGQQSTEIRLNSSSNELAQITPDGEGWRVSQGCRPAQSTTQPD